MSPLWIVIVRSVRDGAELDAAAALKPDPTRHDAVSMIFGISKYHSAGRPNGLSPAATLFHV
jgi:hypothetical protein